MARITLPIPALVGGVSTQPEPTRLPHQGDLSNNTIGSVIDGLRRRPPAEYRNTLSSGADSAYHSVELLEGEYAVEADGDGVLRVWDLEDGTTPDIRDETGGPAGTAAFAYLDTPDPKRDLRFLNLSDYIICLNRSKTVLADEDTHPVRQSQGLVFVQQGAYGARYSITVTWTDQFTGQHRSEVSFLTYNADGSHEEGGVSPGSPSQDIRYAEWSVRTDAITKILAEFLATGQSSTPAGVTPGSSANVNVPLNGLGGPMTGTEWTVDYSGSVLRIIRNNGEPFTLEITESLGNQSMSVIYKTAQLFSDLPLHAPVGMIVEIVGDPNETQASYWARFQPNLEGTAIGKWADGYWEETVAPDISKGLDPTTMPHALLRQSDDTWRFTPLTGYPYTSAGEDFEVPGWTERAAGDEDSNPQPDFVDGKIKDMCFHEGRLGLESATAFYMSETREPFNFYRTTVVELLDSDRIVIKLPVLRAEELTHCVPMGGDIVLFTEETQYLLRSNGPFTPSSISQTAAGRHDCDPNAQPIQVRGELVVPRSTGVSGALASLMASGDQRPTLVMGDMSAAVPGYLQEPYRIFHSPQLDLVFVVGAASPNLGVYSFYYDQEGKKAHQAWQQWTFDVTRIIDGWATENVVHLLVEKDGEVVHVSLRPSKDAQDDDLHLCYLDFRLSSEDLTAVLNGSETTDFTLPFDASTDMIVREQDSRDAVRVLAASGDTLTVEGDYTATPVYIGSAFQFRHDLSKVSMLQDEQGPSALGDIGLETGTVYYHDTGQFEAVIIDDFEAETAEEMPGPYLGVGANYQTRALSSGKFQFPIRGKALDVRVSFRSNGTEPVQLVNMDVTMDIRNTQNRRRYR